MAKPAKKLFEEYPELRSEWDDDRNVGLSPDAMRPFSNKKVWWKCKNGHVWSALISSRVRGNNCPYCSGRYPIKGENDLATTNPELAVQWHPTKNGDLTPADVKSGSNKKVWWVCDKGHEWQANICMRITDNTGCPYCSGRYAIIGENDLLTIRPDIAAEWDYDKNDTSPEDYLPGSDKTVWWKCSKGHEWQAPIYKRAIRGCPYCSNQKVLAGYNDLATTNPEILPYWDYDLNGDTLPTEVIKGSDKKVYLKCPNNHTWQVRLAGIKDVSKSCPYCKGLLPIVSYNDLATRYPDIVAEWDYDKNKKRPEDYLPASNAVVWWKCKQGHEWKTAISHRTLSGTGCPYCAGKRIVPGENDLATLYPNIAKEWHPTKNGALKPCDISAKVGRKVWWRCPAGHEYYMAIDSRTQKGADCPICRKNKQ